MGKVPAPASARLRNLTNRVEFVTGRLMDECPALDPRVYDSLKTVRKELRFSCALQMSKEAKDKQPFQLTPA